MPPTSGRALAQLRREPASTLQRRRNPFGVICGTSAGAINAAALACHADKARRPPQFVKDEFDAFLECGILARGFLRLRRMGHHHTVQ